MISIISWTRFDHKDETTWPDWSKANGNREFEDLNLYLWTDGIAVHPCSFRSLPTDRKVMWWATVYVPKLAS